MTHEDSPGAYCVIKARRCADRRRHKAAAATLEIKEDSAAVGASTRNKKRREVFEGPKRTPDIAPKGGLAGCRREDFSYTLICSAA